MFCWGIDSGGRQMMQPKGVSPAAVLTCGAIAMAAFLITRSDVAGNLCCVAAGVGRAATAGVFGVSPEWRLLTRYFP